ncbi:MULTISPECIES: NAD(P)-dependent oxidoreductase [Streptomyces]|uniref:3-beta hydroxysteroid dehydrogenase n=1 Tax=Streptomyces qinglanensis TaxID=943816 RepID=A0A1E7K657_9ACTN|nr:MULTISPECIES: NAD(P)H-binding protein [Streptomyces]OEU99418.1 3-beta hydroxysteroid dehydrogenase [Streptomyces qinglanensis]OEV26137.1 3-beta hydroxysteroid dehydrogenase [Streptomyces nanshensis]
MATIAVFGANGNIGSRIVREALDRGHQVLAVVRDPGAFVASGEAVTAVTGDVLSAESVAAVAGNADVVVSAVGGKDGPGHLATIEPAAESLVAGVRALGAGAPPLVFVGGAGSLRTPDGSRVWDAEGLPEAILQIMHAHGDALDYLRGVHDVRWTNISPAATIEPGERSGTYRTGKDDLVVDDNGVSRISMEDYAVAVLDEIENPRHVRERFTVAD